MRRILKKRTLAMAGGALGFTAAVLSGFLPAAGFATYCERYLVPLHLELEEVVENGEVVELSSERPVAVYGGYYAWKISCMDTPEEWWR